MKIRYAVTFEFPAKPPVILRGVTEAASPASAAGRAAREAVKGVEGQMTRGWSSVVVLLEREAEQ